MTGSSHRFAQSVSTYSLSTHFVQSLIYHDGVNELQLYLIIISGRMTCSSLTNTCPRLILPDTIMVKASSTNAQARNAIFFCQNLPARHCGKRFEPLELGRTITWIRLHTRCRRWYTVLCDELRWGTGADSILCITVGCTCMLINTYIKGMSTTQRKGEC